MAPNAKAKAKAKKLAQQLKQARKDVARFKKHSNKLEKQATKLTKERDEYRELANQIPEDEPKEKNAEFYIDAMPGSAGWASWALNLAASVGKDPDFVIGTARLLFETTGTSTPAELTTPGVQGLSVARWNSATEGLQIQLGGKQPREAIHNH